MTIRGLRGRGARAPDGHRHAPSASSRASSTCARGSRATTSATARSPRRARTRRSCTGPATTASSARATCCCWTPASRVTTSTPPTSRARCRCRAASRGPQREIYELVLAAQQAGDRRGASRRRLPGAQHGRDAGARRRASSTSGSCTSVPRRRCAPSCRCTPLHAARRLAHARARRPRLRARARRPTTSRGPSRSAIVLTVEPGLYFQPDDLTVPEQYRGIGVRIEDDVARHRRRVPRALRRAAARARRGRGLDGRPARAPHAEPRALADRAVGAAARARPRRCGVGGQNAWRGSRHATHASYSRRHRPEPGAEPSAHRSATCQGTTRSARTSRLPGAVRRRSSAVVAANGGFATTRNGRRGQAQVRWRRRRRP